MYLVRQSSSRVARGNDVFPTSFVGLARRREQFARCFRCRVVLRLTSPSENTHTHTHTHMHSLRNSNAPRLTYSSIQYQQGGISQALVYFIPSPHPHDAATRELNAEVSSSPQSTPAVLVPSVPTQLSSRTALLDHLLLGAAGRV